VSSAPYSAALHLFKVESDINGILPAERAPAIYFVSPLNRLRSALWEVTVFCVGQPAGSFLAASCQAQKDVCLEEGKQEISF
jgi:hypothetical protein